MPKTEQFFEETLAAKLEENPDLADIDAVFQFDIEGAGTWSVSLKPGELWVRKGPAEAPDCVISTGAAEWEQVVDDPMKATEFFMAGSLQASDLGLAMQLQQLLA